MTRVLLLYCGQDGQTRKIMSRIRDLLARDTVVEMRDLREKTPETVVGYQAVVIGAGIRYGYFPKIMRRFAADRALELNQLPTAFFGVCLTARKPHKRTPESNAYLRKFLAGTPWQPGIKAAFAGALLYPRYRWYDRMTIQMIMRMTGGETDASKEVEYTDWDQVEAFAAAFVTSLSEKSDPAQ